MQFCRRFYKISAWLGTYFPVRLVVFAVLYIYPHPVPVPARECVIAAVYMMTAACLTLAIEKRTLPKA